MISLSERSQNVTPSSTLAITAKINALIADGVDVVKFGAGEPDFDTPDYIKDAAIAALNEGFTKYTPVPGTPELREAITKKFKRDNGLSYKPSEVIVSCGAKHTIYNIMQAICDPGDEVIFAAPYWVSYPEQIKLAGAVPSVIETTPSQNFCMAPDQVEAAITPKTKAILVNSPSNPTGTTYDLDTLQQRSLHSLSSIKFISSPMKFTRRCSTMVRRIRVQLRLTRRRRRLLLLSTGCLKPTQ